MALGVIARTGLAAALLAFSATAANAVILNLDTDDPPEGQSDFQDPRDPFPDDIGFVEEGDRATAGRFGITFQNIINSMADTPDFPVSPPGGGVDEDGIFFGSTGDLEIVQMDLVFDIATRIDVYDIDFVGEAIEIDAFFGFRSWFVISGPNGTSGDNFIDETGRFAFDMGTIERFLPGVPYTLTHNIFDYGGPGGFDVIAQIDEFELSAVPLPMPFAMLLGGMALLGWRARRRQAQA